jgi:hypothetical protein
MATRSNGNKGVTGRNTNVPPPARNTQNNTQAISRIPGVTYGEQQELTKQQQDAPLAKESMPTQPAAKPFNPVNVFAQSQLPDQPITDGAALGPGRQGANLTPQEIGDLFIVALAEKFPTSDTFALADDGLVRFDIEE